MEEANLEGDIKEEETQIKPKCKLENIKSKYILEKLFTIVQRKTELDIVKYNKIIKNKIDININDYKEFSGKYSSIYIKLKPIPKKFGNFINIKTGEERYYHIYFNYKNEEINRNYINENEQVDIILIRIDYHVMSFKNLFSNISCVEWIHFVTFYRNNINDMSFMFFGCSSLLELTLDNFNTNSVTNMSYMFYRCSLLKELNLNNFNTANVNDMSYMFYECLSLKKLNINNFNTNNVTNMLDMFDGCSSIEVLNLNNFNTVKVKNMYGMFSRCSSLKELNLYNFDTNNVTNMSDMFDGCSSLHTLYIDNFTTNNVKDMSYMFYNCSKLISLNLKNFNTNNVRVTKMFYGCSNELKMQIKTEFKNIEERAFYD